MTRAARILGLGLAVAWMAGAQELPSELQLLAAKARLDDPVAAWCRAEFRSGDPNAFAVAVSAARGGGRYLALEGDGSVTELARFERSADLACYSRARAENLDASLRASETIHGHIRPRWNTTVVCAFTDDTMARCWQYSPGDRAFVEVGRWVT